MVLGKLFQGGVALRNFLFDAQFLSTYQATVPVISVGNISVGGTGKTPFTIFLLKKLQKEGFTPCVLSRGYGGSHRGPVVVDPQHSYKEVGDEPLVLARHAPVVVSKKRVLGAQFIERNTLGNIIILDDGFQHRYLKRDFDIVLFNATDKRYVEDVLQERMLPFGTLREPVSALHRASCIILSNRGRGNSEYSSQLEKIIPHNLPLFRSQLNFIGVFRGEEKLLPMECIALSTIASPGGFHAMLEEHGFHIKDKIVLRDHAILKHEFLTELINKKTPIIITEKDLVKIPEDLRMNFFVAKIEVTLNVSDSFDYKSEVSPEKKFMRILFESIQV